MDIILLLLFMGVNVLSYACVHLFLFNQFNVKKIATILNFSTAVSLIIAIPFEYFIFRSHFSTIETAQVAIVGAGMASFFATSLYGFVGPICADRSLSAHMVILLRRAGGRMTEEALKAAYTQKMVIDKRLVEHEDVGVIQRDGDVIQITEKGTRIAIVFEKMIKLLKLKENF